MFHGDPRLSAGPKPRDETYPRASTRPEVEQWVRAIRTGRSKDRAFRDLFHHYLPSVVYFFVSRGFSREDAEDLAQDVLLSVYRNVGGFRAESSFDTWLYRILTNVWKNAVRSRNTLKGLAERTSWDEVVDQGRADRLEPADAAESPLEKVMDEERRQLLMGAVEQLPPKMRQCVLLRAFQGLRYREIAELMGISATTVKTQLQTASQRLKPLLEEHVDVLLAREPG